MERKYIRIDENGNFLADEWYTQKPDDENVIETLPPQGLYKPKWNGSEWVEGKSDTERLADVKKAKKNELFQACEKEINSSFVSSVLGIEGNNIEFFYDSTAQSKLNSQTNKVNIYMNQLSLGKITQEEYDAKFPISWRTKSHGWVQLSESDYLTVTDDAEVHERNNLQKRSQLEGQVDAATTIEEVQAIVWDQ